MQKLFDTKFIRFIFFGGLNTIFAYLILVLFLFLKFHYSIATLISALLSIFSGYLINKFFVFNSKNPKSIFIYYIFWFILYFLSISIQYILLELLLIENLYFNSLIATIASVIISFIVNKYYFFKD